MANVRAQVVFQAFNNLPEDRYVNTWHFSNGQSFMTHIAGVESTLDAFYTAENPQFEELHQMLSPVLNRTYEYRFYDLSQPEPRVPVIVSKSMPSAAATLGFPEELSVVCTFHGAPPVTRRRRGRIYFGPLANFNTISSGDVDTFSSVHINLRTHLANAQLAMLNQALATLSGWAVRSTVPAENFVTVVGGYVDNAIDIQRRRGADATGRHSWP